MKRKSTDIIHDNLNKSEETNSSIKRQNKKHYNHNRYIANKAKQSPEQKEKIRPLDGLKI